MTSIVEQLELNMKLAVTYEEVKENIELFELAFLTLPGSQNSKMMILALMIVKWCFHAAPNSRADGLEMMQCILKYIERMLNGAYGIKESRDAKPNT